MSLPIKEEHLALAKVVHGFLEHHDVTHCARANLDDPVEQLPPFWEDLRSIGWLGLHLPEEFGGDGFGLSETAVVVEQLGRHIAPGPFLSTVITSAVILANGADEMRSRYLPGLATGEVIGAIGLAGSLTMSASGAVEGDAGAVLGAGLADILLLTVGEDLVVVSTTAEGVELTREAGLDPTRHTWRITCHAVQPDSVISGGGRHALVVARTLVAAEAAGLAGAGVEMATSYAKSREQFGRPIATFQAIKHRCAEMLVDSELAVAAVWDAARFDGNATGAEMAAATAYSRAIGAAITVAERNIQVHGGIGFTWEHDAHIYLRRGLALRAVFGSPAGADSDLATWVGNGVERHYTVDLPAEAETYRSDAQQVAARVSALPAESRRAELVASGYLVPHWPRPWGLAASAAQQLVIEEEFADVSVPTLGITGWNVLTIIQFGTPEQLSRWVEKSLLGQLVWCQLFSEPGAGSDAAAIRTAGVRVDGGWRVTGQKVWTTRAHRSDWGFATVRTDASGPKHTGVTMMAVDMKAPGVDVRPLRELTGDAVFNEVFLDDVFIPDSDVVGNVGEGWAVARAALGNERVSIGGAPTALKVTASDLVGIIERSSANDPGYLRRAGSLIAEEQAIKLLNLRQAVRAIEGAGPGLEGNVTKLLTAEHGQRVTEFALELVGSDAIAGSSDEVSSYLLGRCYTIAGGTSEIVRNQIAERLLGMPRDPLQR